MKLYFLLAGLISAILFAPADGVAQQREPERNFRHALSVEPLYLFVDGLRINYERQLQAPNHWLEISAIGYAQKNSETWRNWFFNGNHSDKAWGLGAEASYKYFVKPFMYISGGAAYGHQSVTFSRQSIEYSRYTEDELVFYEPVFKQTSHTGAWNKIVGNLRIGFQTKSTRRMVVGGYIGVSYVYSFYDSELISLPNDPVTLGFRGFTPHAGFRIGTRF
jgi:hypothetical protein